MEIYIQLHEKDVEKAANKAGIKNPDDIKNLMTICAFLSKNPDLISWRGKIKPDPNSLDGINKFSDKFFASRRMKKNPKEPNTIPDPAVSIAMQQVYGYTKEKAESIKIEHQHSMSCENIVGAILERYIAEKMEPYGWVWCAGDFVKGVDFIKYNQSKKEWIAIQVKNRNNSENSSSSKIRIGTEIKKWHRSFSRKDTTNWNNFPEEEFRDELSETGFIEFLKKHLSTQG